MLQKVIVGIIVIISILYLFRVLVKICNSKKGCQSCPFSNSCKKKGAL